jgi:cobalt/nickel transport system permease protein
MPSSRTEERDDPGTEEHPRVPGLGSHPHVHEGEHEHRHPHHHEAAREHAHDHGHTLGFERYTFLVSPIHDMDPRFKLVASFLFVFGVVVGPALRPLEFALLFALLLAVTVISRVPVRWLLTRSAIVLPIALSIAAFAPLGRATEFSVAGIVEAYAENYTMIWAIASKSWISAYTMLLLSATTPMPLLFKGLASLRMPTIFITLLTFLYRFTDVFGNQLRTMRHAVASRAPQLHGLGLIRLYGNLAGNLFIRAYERGERIHDAMLSRGYTGVLPTTGTLSAGPADWLLIFTTLLVVAAVLLY